jgi:protein TonB
MDFARQQRDPTRHAIGITFVVLMHVLIIWALLSGLGRTVVEVIKKPLNATIVEELKAPPPPPPPPKKIVEAPKVKPPPEVYVPPPDVPVPTTQEAPVITAVTPTPPVEQHVIAPPAPAPEPPKPAVRRGIQAQRIGGDYPEYPKAALKEGIERGRVVARLNIDEKGNVTDVIVTYAEPPKYFDRAVVAALKTWKFRAEGEKYVGEVEVNFSLKD